MMLMMLMKIFTRLSMLSSVVLLDDDDIDDHDHNHLVHHDLQPLLVCLLDGVVVVGAALVLDQPRSRWCWYCGTMVPVLINKVLVLINMVMVLIKIVLVLMGN